MNNDVFDGFEILKLFEYQHKHLNEKSSSMTFIDFFCRGSSKKDFIDINEKLIILFLHEGGLYKWSEQEKDKLVHLFDTEAEKFIHVADNKFMLLQNCYDD